MANRGSFGSYGDSSYSSYHAGGQAAGGGNNEFTRLTQVVGNNIQKITQNVAQMQQMVNKIGTNQDSPELRDKLHQVQHYTNQLAKDTNKYLQELAHLPNPQNQSEQRQRKMQKERLTNDFATSLNNFQAVQRKTAEKEKISVARARTSSGLNYDPFADERKSDDHLVSLDSPTQQQSVQMEQDVDVELIREREQAIHKLESDILDVNSIFKDLGVLVHDQGEVIDSIESNVESTEIHVEDGRKQLEQASTYQSKARRKKCILLIIVLVVLAVLGLILGLTLNK